MHKTLSICSATVALLGVVAPLRMAAETAPPSEKLALLYSNQFAFDRRGVPLITVRIAEGQDTVTVEGDRGLSVLPDGEGGAEVTGSSRYAVTLTNARAAELEHFVILASEPEKELAKVQQQLATWKQRGARTRLLEIGTVFGLKGQVFDNRAYLLLDGPYPSAQTASAKAEQYLSQQLVQKVATLPQIKRYPAGTFMVRDSASSTEVRATDVVWFAPKRDGRITVRTSDSTKSYWGLVYTAVGADGKIAVVNAIDADRMLAGLVPSEIYARAPRAALQAQAVAARGELLVKLGTRHLVDPYLLCATVHCQAYHGAGREHPDTTRAVNDTRGLVLTRADGRLVDTVYSASAGGFTENNDNTWPVKPDPNLRGHLDAAPDVARADRQLTPFAAGITAKNLDAWLATRPRTFASATRFNQEKYRWQKAISQAEMDALCRDLAVGAVQEVRVLERGVSGRALLVQVVGSRQTINVRGELIIRRRFGNLWSSMFIVKREGQGPRATFRFIGGGWGHGVGMCQTGAIGMAEAKKTYQEILRHYYQGSELRQIY